MATTLGYLNACDREALVASLGHLFEHSPWVAEETWPRRPFASAEVLHAALCATMRAAPRERQLALVRAHPDLAGRLAQQRKLTAESTREQASAGLNQLTDAELAEFTRLNDAYRAQFGFPFIICARLNAKDAILAALRTRSAQPPDAEFAAALAEIEKIARLRLQDILGNH
ncbi:MAG: 2-oxo-4-hydroxy-4-carboxy-5-ureidoimidazoline decarboxylase [Opitutae bacterium]|nr:2-oxo-4-hydroxy-4-carboxy-5-ureidoimidazoline decarboxylase [Opitutae bacterium]